MATYVEGSSLHPERGGASTFARYAFDELWSFVAGWAILLDYLIVMAIGAVVDLATTWRSSGASSTTGMLRDRSSPAGALAVRGVPEHPRAVAPSGCGTVLRLSLRRHRACSRRVA